MIVEWDTGFKAHYRFGSTRKFSNKYDIQLCNEPRILGNELIATGCLVTRGYTILLFLRTLTSLAFVLAKLITIFQMLHLFHNPNSNIFENFREIVSMKYDQRKNCDRM